MKPPRIDCAGRFCYVSEELDPRCRGHWLWLRDIGRAGIQIVALYPGCGDGGDQCGGLAPPGQMLGIFRESVNRI